MMKTTTMPTRKWKGKRGKRGEWPQKVHKRGGGEEKRKEEEGIHGLD